MAETVWINLTCRDDRFWFFTYLLFIRRRVTRIVCHIDSSYKWLKRFCGAGIRITLKPDQELEQFSESNKKGSCQQVYRLETERRIFLLKMKVNR
jgi:hypothetical protein